MTLIELMMAMTVMAIALLGLTAGVVLAFGANSRSSRRSQAAEFAQSSMERLIAASRKNICTYNFTGNKVSCSSMGSGAFVPNSAPNQGGWMLDILDRANALVGSSGTTSTNPGIDLMAGPVVVIGDSGAVDEAATLTARSTVLTAWGSGSTAANAGCGDSDPAVTTSRVTRNMLCREIHIELHDFANLNGAALTLCSVGASCGYHIWVRVVRGGGFWNDGPVVLEGVVAQ